MFDSFREMTWMANIECLKSAKVAKKPANLNELDGGNVKISTIIEHTRGNEILIYIFPCDQKVLTVLLLVSLAKYKM